MKVPVVCPDGAKNYVCKYNKKAPKFGKVTVIMGKFAEFFYSHFNNKKVFHQLQMTKYQFFPLPISLKTNL